jgi:hypothetical protein
MTAEEKQLLTEARATVSSAEVTDDQLFSLRQGLWRMVRVRHLELAALSELLEEVEEALK